MPQTPRPPCLSSLRQSRGLVIAVVFVAMMLDVILMTSVDPILPAILANLQDAPSNVTNHSLTSPVTLGPDNTASRMTTVAPSSNVTASGGKDYMSMTLQIGVLVAAKPLLEMVTNIAVGSVVDRILMKPIPGPYGRMQSWSSIHVDYIMTKLPLGLEIDLGLITGCGHRWPMLIGFLFNFAATVGFGYAPTYGWLLVTRLAQAVGSSLSVVSGLAFLAAAFPDDAARCDATGKAFGGISLGIILGYPYGSIVYQLMGPKAPFLILGAATLADGALRMLVVLPSQPNKSSHNIQSEGLGCLHGLYRLLGDPYILIGLGCSFVQHFGLGVFLATGPAWMLQELHAEQWSIGVVLAVAVVFHFTAQYVTGKVALKVGRWLFCWVGMMVFSLGIALYPLCTVIWEVLGPEVTVRLGHGTVLCVVSPLLAHVADVRHQSQYGLVYGLYSASYNMGLGVGPIVGGQLAMMISFNWLYWGTAIIIFLYSFLTLAYRKPSFLANEPSEVKVPSYGAVESFTNPKLESSGETGEGGAPCQDIPESQPIRAQ